jgi:hypothetical protein
MDEEKSERRVVLSAAGTVDAAGNYEVMAITAGVGNGWDFGESCLQESLALWDGAECFVDHSWSGHSLRDLAGVCYAPAWDEAERGVQVKLRAVGPSAGLLAELAKELLLDGPKPRIGFSADVVFTAQAKKVQKILRVLSVDLVFNPARGGAFKRALNSVYPGSQGKNTEVFEMSEEVVNKPEVSITQAQLETDREAVRMLLDEQKRQIGAGSGSGQGARGAG